MYPGVSKFQCALNLSKAHKDWDNKKDYYEMYVQWKYFLYGFGSVKIH